MAQTTNSSDQSLRYCPGEDSVSAVRWQPFDEQAGAVTGGIDSTAAAAVSDIVVRELNAAEVIDLRLQGASTGPWAASAQPSFHWRRPSRHGMGGHTQLAEDIVLAALDAGGAVRASVRIRIQPGGSCAQLSVCGADKIGDLEYRRRLLREAIETAERRLR